MSALPVAGWRLYRFFGYGGVLLYVGKSNDAGRRLLEHLRHQPWWDEVQAWQVDPRIWPTEAAVLRAERVAIETERPGTTFSTTGATRTGWTRARCA